MEWRRASREKAHELPKWVLDDVSSFFSSLLLEGFSSSLHSYYSRDFGSFNFIWVWRNTRSRFSVRSNGLDLVTVGLDERQDNRRHRNGKPHQMKLNQISAATCTNFGQLLLIHGLTHTHTLTRTHSLTHRPSVDLKIEFRQRVICGGDGIGDIANGTKTRQRLMMVRMWFDDRRAKAKTENYATMESMEWRPCDRNQNIFASDEENEKGSKRESKMKIARIARLSEDALPEYATLAFLPSNGMKFVRIIRCDLVRKMRNAGQATATSSFFEIIN